MWSTARPLITFLAAMLIGHWFLLPATAMTMAAYFLQWAVFYLVLRSAGGLTGALLIGLAGLSILINLGVGVVAGLTLTPGVFRWILAEIGQADTAAVEFAFPVLSVYLLTILCMGLLLDSRRGVISRSPLPLAGFMALILMPLPQPAATHNIYRYLFEMAIAEPAPPFLTARPAVITRT